MSEEQWQYFQKTMQQKIRKEWADRFRQMKKDKSWTYDDIAKVARFKNGKVVAATISRGLPAFAKLTVLMHEQCDEKKSS